VTGLRILLLNPDTSIGMTERMLAAPPSPHPERSSSR
jgi:hypothetical protein